MTRTRALPLLIASVVLALAGFGLEALLVASGRPAVTPPVSLGIVLAIIAVLLLGFAWPVRQVSRGNRPSGTVGFRHATNVLSFAKASIVLGVIVAALTLGVAIFALTRPMISAGLLTSAIVAVVGGVVLVVSGVLAESWCELPPDDGEANDGAEATG